MDDGCFRKTNVTILGEIQPLMFSRDPSLSFFSVNHFSVFFPAPRVTGTQLATRGGFFGEAGNSRFGYTRK